MKYKDFDAWFDEIENYGMRGERFHGEFFMVEYERRTRMIEWLQAAGDCARMKEEK